MVNPDKAPKGQSDKGLHCLFAVQCIICEYLLCAAADVNANDKILGYLALILICHWVAYRLTLTSISTFQLLNHLSFLLDLVQVFTHVGTAINFFIKRSVSVISIKCLHREGQPTYSTSKTCLMVEHPSVNHLFFVPNPAVTPVTGVHGVGVGLSLVLKLV